jgi:catechol 2,3-dioxygenase-like lactoylglutathione lyase family enzyme
VIDHVGLHVSNLESSKRFFERALAPLGYETKFEQDEFVGMGAGQSMDLGLIRRDPVAGGQRRVREP